MPGLAGVLSEDPSTADRCERMATALGRREGDTVSQLRLAQAGLHVAWVERADSTMGVRPVWNESRDVCVLLYGDVFDDESIAQELRRHGHDVGSGPDAHLVHLYEEMGPAFLEGLNGGFCGLLVDLRARRTLLFNDRYGIGRVYVTPVRGGLAFATEAKAILRAFPKTRRLDTAALGEMFGVGCVLRNRTLFEGIQTLPPASCWTVQPSGHREEAVYFDPRTWESQTPLADRDFMEALTATFSTRLARYLRGPGVGMSLTGGLDGRMIMAWAAAAPGSLPCYSFVGPYRECHDVRIARKIAKACGQPHHVIPVGAHMLRDFPQLAADCIRISDGTMDVSGGVELFVNRAAHAIAPVRVTGNYGSEIVRGNVAFRPQRLELSLYEAPIASAIDAASDVYAQERQGGDLSFVAFKQVPWYHYARASVERSQLDVRSPFLDNELVALMYRASPAMLASREPSLELIHAGNARLATIPTDRGYRRGEATTLDRLRQAVLDFSAKAEYAYDYGMPSWLTRIDTALSPLCLQRLFLGRHKFYHFRTWYRRELSSYLRDVLLSPRARARSPYRDGVLEHMVEEHVDGRDNHTDELHRALTHELIHQCLLDESASQAPALAGRS